MSRALLFLIIAAIVVNLVGALGPELGFDALWYHLTIPKLYLLAGKIYHIPGGLLYYSEMPRLSEILYMFIPPHLLSWGAGIGTAIVTYKLARKYLSSTFALLASAIFYVTPLVSWQSGSAYIDLFRTLFEVLALYLVLSKKSLLAGLVIGLAISTKTLALGSIIPLTVLIFLTTKNLRTCLLSAVCCLLVALPWFLSAYLNTGYPFYPIGAGILDSRHVLNLDLWNLPKVFGEFWKLFVTGEDPISPIYFIVLPFFIPILRNKKFIGLLVYWFIGLLLWYVSPRTGGGRFILPYLPAFAILVSAIATKYRFLLAASLAILFINLGYRSVATARLIPYLTGRESKTAYLCRNLDLKVTYVNCNSFHPPAGELTMVKGYHNLYYIDFPFVHESWYRGERYNNIIQP